MKLLSIYEKSKNIWFLIFTSFIFFLLRLPSLIEPYWYGDEGIYQALGLGINNGRILYQGIFDNKPPFLYLLYAIFNSDQFLLRSVSLIFGLISIYIFFILAKKVFQSQKPIFLSTFLFAILFGLPLIEGNIANAENFMLAFNLGAGLLAFKSLETNLSQRYKLLFVSGILLSISFLFKIVGIFDFAAFFIFIFFANFSKDIKNILEPKNLINEFKNLLPLIIGFSILPILVVGYFIFNNAFPYFLKATLTNNVGYVGYGNKLIIPQGFLILKLLILFTTLSIIFIKRQKLILGEMFIYIWLLFSLFNAFFSQRPYTHYVLVTLPAICLLTGLLLLKKNFKLSALALIISIFLLYKNFGYYNKTTYYYQNFIAFITNNKTIYDYERFFDGNTPNDYLLASFLNMHLKKDDNIFVWGNNAQLYKLTDKLPPGRYTVAYHITSYPDGISNTRQGLEKTQPRFIIIMHNVSAYPFSLTNYQSVVNLNGIVIYEKIN